jgi:hypothetical protein
MDSKPFKKIFLSFIFLERTDRQGEGDIDRDREKEIGRGA